MSEGSTLPPLRITPTGQSPATLPVSTAASPAADAGSTTCFVRSSSSTSARAISSSVTDHHVVDELAGMSERELRHLLDRDAVGDGVDPIQRHRLALAQRELHVGRTSGLDADHPAPGAQRLHRCADTADQPTATHRDDDGLDLFGLLRQLETDRALARDDQRVVERGDEHRPDRLGALAERPRLRPRTTHLRVRTSAP